MIKKIGRPRGSKNRSYRRIISHGYVMVWCPGHPEAYTNGYAREHRKVVHDCYGEIPPKAVIHHVNGNKQDNRIDNLLIITNEEHTRHHFKGSKFPRHGSTVCKTTGCETLQKSRYGLCTKHYTIAWDRKNRRIHEHSERVTGRRE